MELTALPKSNGNEYLRFSEADMKKLLIEQLTLNSDFTDQEYEDSNMSIIIDTFSYMFATLMFYMNNSAAESIFTDARMYENMNRIVKLIGYNPGGYITSIVDANIGPAITLRELPSRQITIPRYAYIAAGADANGNTIRYASSEDFSIVSTSDISLNKISLHNGQWTAYNAGHLSDTLIATGIPWETHIMGNVDNTRGMIVSHNHIHIYISGANDDIYRQYQQVMSMHMASPGEEAFEVRLDENKQYSVKFGDGVNGNRLKQGQKIRIIYLNSQCKGGMIQQGDIGSPTSTKTLQYDRPVYGMETSDVISMLGLNIESNDAFMKEGAPMYNIIQNIESYNESASSSIREYETVDEIRESAPDWFKMNNRLVTEDDFDIFLRNKFSEIHDIVIMNNTTYMNEFMQWLYRYDKLRPDIIKYHYKFSDTCDFNNVYIWVKPRNSVSPSSQLMRSIKRQCEPIKALTCDVIPLEPIIINMSPCFPYFIDPDTKVRTNTDKTNYVEVMEDTRIRIVRNRNSLVTIEHIERLAIETISQFFDTTHMSFGQNVNLGELYSLLSAINGVEKIQMVWLSDIDGVDDIVMDTLSFASWSSFSYMEMDDFEMISGNIQLRPFQFPQIYSGIDWKSRIDVTADNYMTGIMGY